MKKNYAEGEPARFAAAMLRLVLALKRRPEADPNEVIEQIIELTGVEPRAFRQFLAAHMEVMSRVTPRR